MAFDDNGDRMYAEYDVINVRDHQVKKIVGSFHYEAVREAHNVKIREREQCRTFCTRIDFPSNIQFH